MAKTNKSDQNYCKSTFDLNQKVNLRPKLAFILIKYWINLFLIDLSEALNQWVYDSHKISALQKSLKIWSQ